MPRTPRAALLLAGLLAPSASVRAGVYDTTERQPFPIITAQDKVNGKIKSSLSLQDAVARAAKASGNEESSERKELVNRVESLLEPKYKKGELLLDERINLSAAYIRLGRAAKAIPLVKAAFDDGPQQVKDDAPERFLLLANLASAYHATGDLHSAISTQREALTAAPAQPPLAVWSPEQWAHLRIAERYYLMLLEHRYEETERPKAGKAATVDNLFPKVRFVGLSGHYEAGKISPDNLHELPRDALPIVVQLLHWQPTDARLAWLYGELLNAEGRINEAYRTLNDLLFSGAMGGEELKSHRQLLQGALVPEKKDKDDSGDKLVPEESKPAADKPAKGMPDWRLLGTGFGAGLLVATFGFMQLYLWSRRRRAPAATPVRHHP